MEFYKVREQIETFAETLCEISDAPASSLPKKVIDWITNVYIDDYLDDEEERQPEYTDFLKGVCDYLQEECQEK